MSPTVRLSLVFHNHQPIGNFEGVFEEAYRDSYAPFLEVLREYPDIKVSIHISRVGAKHTLPLYLIRLHAKL